MKTQVPLWLVLAACAGCLAIGRAPLDGVLVREAQAQGEAAKPAPEGGLTEYPYLPHRYGEAYIPSIAEWQALRLTALGASTTRLTDQFNRQHLTCFPT